MACGAVCRCNPDGPRPSSSSSCIHHLRWSHSSPIPSAAAWYCKTKTRELIIWHKWLTKEEDEDGVSYKEEISITRVWQRKLFRHLQFPISASCKQSINIISQKSSVCMKMSACLPFKYLPLVHERPSLCGWPGGWQLWGREWGSKIYPAAASSSWWKI